MKIIIKNKNIKNINSQIGIFNNKNNYDLNGNILQQINSTSSSFQDIKNNNNSNINNTLSNEYKYLGQINNNLNIFNQIPFNSRGSTKSIQYQIKLFKYNEKFNI